jgi:spore coat polysaccharide biosynthesis predicted glycosyltransferase SpsG
VLFVPVSGPGGAGELMRCLIVARALRNASPRCDIHFVVSRDAALRNAVDFTIHDCDDSPTRSTAQVIDILARLRPQVVVFDSAGRTEQLRTAKRLGAKIVFCSRSRRLRWKAFQLRWMRLLDEHWVIYPRFLAGDLGWLQRLKLRLVPQYTLRFFDTFFAPSDPAVRADWLRGQGLPPGGFTVFVPGGRGPGQRAAVDPVDLFVTAATLHAAATGVTTVVLSGRETAAGQQPAAARVRVLPRLVPDEVQHLLAAADRVVSNGGGTLIHALAHGKAVVSAPVAGDQAARIRRAARLGIVVPAEPEAAAIATAVNRLACDPQAEQALRTRVATFQVHNAVDEAVTALRQLAQA